MTTNQSIDRYRSDFTLFEKGLNGEASTPLHAIRRAAISRFGEMGFPTTRNEEWRFTNVLPIAKSEFTPARQGSEAQIKIDDVERFFFGGLHSYRLTFVNGFFAPALSAVHQVPDDVVLGNLSSILATEDAVVHDHLTRHARFSDDAFTALNTAFIRDGAVVVVPAGKIVEHPVHLLFISTGKESFVAHPRNLIVAGNSGQVSVVESYVHLGDMPYFTNAVTEIVAGENAVVEHDKLQTENVKAFHIGTIHIHQSSNSNYTSNSVALGGALVRNNITSVLDGQGIECTLNGLSLASGTQHIDNHTTIDHAKPHCSSHELYKSIIDGKARGVFNGKIFVRKDAQKTDAKQTNKTLLLSEQAAIDTKPQLEIFADDVKCTHGATIGQLDKEQIFYLRSRGMGNFEARDLLTFAFASDVVDRIRVTPLKERLHEMIQARLQRGRLTRE